MKFTILTIFKYIIQWASLIAQLAKNLPAMQETLPGSGRSPGEGRGYPLQYSGLENSMDYSSWSHKESDTTEHLSLITCQFSGIKSIHNVLQPSPLSVSRTFSSSWTETWHSFNNNSSFPQLCWPILYSTVCLYEFAYSREYKWNDTIFVLLFPAHTT